MARKVNNFQDIKLLIYKKLTDKHGDPIFDWLPEKRKRREEKQLLKLNPLTI